MPVPRREEQPSDGERYAFRSIDDRLCAIVGRGGDDGTELGEAAVERDRQNPREPDEIAVGREHRQAAAFGDRTDQEVGIRTLYALGAAGVEVFRGPLVVRGDERLVGEGLQLHPELLERCRAADATEEFLPDRPNHRDPTFVDERTQLPHRRVVEHGTPAERQRPH